MVSIITPLYNSEKYILETYKSIQSQSYSDWEWIIVDDSSTDKSLEIVRSVAAEDSRLVVMVNTGQKGPGNCRNIGITASSGKFMTFIDSDDIWYPEFIEKSMKYCSENKVDFVFSSYDRYDESLKHKIDTFTVPDKVNYKGLLKTCSISCLTAFINIEKLGKKFMPNISKRQDYALWLAYLKEVDYAYGIQEPLAKYRIRKKSVSSNKFKLIKYQFNIYRNNQNLNWAKSVYFTLNWAIHGLIKYKRILFMKDHH